MNVTRLRKKKHTWTELYIFGNLCNMYFKRKKKYDIEELEKILVLMQNESLERYNVPLLTFKTYIYDKRIYHEYLSDLLRVKYSEHIVDDSYMIWAKVKKYEYDKMLMKYMSLSSCEINEMFFELIQSEALNEKYFIMSHPKNEKKFRLRARYEFNKRGISFLLDYLAVPCIILIIFYLITSFVRMIGMEIQEYDYNELLSVIIILFPFLIIKILFTSHIILKPTKFEIENGYSDGNR